MKKILTLAAVMSLLLFAGVGGNQNAYSQDNAAGDSPTRFAFVVGVELWGLSDLSAGLHANLNDQVYLDGLAFFGFVAPGYEPDRRYRGGIAKMSLPFYRTSYCDFYGFGRLLAAQSSEELSDWGGSVLGFGGGVGGQNSDGIYLEVGYGRFDYLSTLEVALGSRFYF